MQTIIISRTDKIGDVILTLPVIHFLRDHFKNIKIIFLCQSYTQPIVQCAYGVDEILLWDSFLHCKDSDRVEQFRQLNADAIIHVFPDKLIAQTAFRAGIPIRIGTSHRWYHLLYCNKLVSFSRKRSELHETQLNVKLLKPLGIDLIPSMERLKQLQLLSFIPELDETTRRFIEPNKINIVMHPHSKGSAREWPLKHYCMLCEMLSEDNYNIIFAGTKEEANHYASQITQIQRSVKDAGGQLSLTQYISLIAHCQALVAASTGPLHIAAATGIHAFGIYPPIRPMHAGRWAPLGQHVHVLTMNKTCNKCKKSDFCQCMENILPHMVFQTIQKTFFSIKQ